MRCRGEDLGQMKSDLHYLCSGETFKTEMKNVLLPEAQHQRVHGAHAWCPNRCRRLYDVENFQDPLPGSSIKGAVKKGTEEEAITT